MIKLTNNVINTQNSVTYRYVLNIYRMTTHNGPGIRTLIQFKGCPLHCLWCSTPESQKDEPELAFYPDRCIQCNRCASVCHLNAIKIKNEGISINRSRCDNCGKCCDVCNSEALKLLGRAMTIEELLEEVRRDEVFYKHSGGGVTLSGGEPLWNPYFAGELLRALKEEGVNTGVDTCGYIAWEDLEPMLPYVKFFLWDIKHMDPDIHKKLTGVSNKRILSNARAVSDRNIPIYVRIPLISGYNDSEENMRATCEFAQGLSSLVEIDLVPLHHLGKAKYDSLNRTYPISETLSVSDTTLLKMKQLIQLYGIKCNIIT